MSLVIMAAARRAVVWSFGPVLVFGILSACRGTAARADCNDPFGKPHEVLDFHVRMKRADWNQLLAFTLRPDDCVGKYPEFRAEFRCGTSEPWLKVAVRKKRGTERGVEAPQKPPLKIDINEEFMGQVPEARGQRWPAALGPLGYRKLTLNNGQANKPSGATFLLPVLLKEHVALRLSRREIALAPGTAYAKLFIHFEDRPDPEYHGVYILIEDIDRSAIERRGPPARGRLIKQTKPSCAPEVEFDDGLPNPSVAAFDAWIKKDPGSYRGGWLAETEKGLDLEALLRQEAIREILVNGTDTILNNTGTAQKLGNNYFAFDPRAGAFRQYIGWDMDQAFGHLYTLCMPTPYKCAPQTPLLAQCNQPLDPNLSILGRLTVCQPEIQRRYLETMCQLINGSLSAAEIIKVWDEADRTVRPVIPLERQPIWNGRDPLDVKIDMSYGAEYVRLRSWIPQRVASVRQQITARGIACPTGCPAGAAETCRVLSCAGVRRCDKGLWTPCEVPATCWNRAGAQDAGSSPAMDAGTSASADGATAGSDASADGGAAGPGAAAGADAGGALDGRRATTGGPPQMAADGSEPPASEEPAGSGGACGIGRRPHAGSKGAVLLVATMLVLGTGRRRRKR